MCEVAVFEKGASATENSLTKHRRSLFVEKNYGDQDRRPTAGAVSGPASRASTSQGGQGRPDGWTNTRQRAPDRRRRSGRMPTGLIDVYTRDRGRRPARSPTTEL